jgi:omega-amidase
MREMTVAVVQMAPRLGEPEENIRRMSDIIRRICGEQPTDLVIFPELVTTGYELGVGFTDLAERLPGHTVNLLAKDAAEMQTHVVFGMPIKEKVESVLYDAAVCLGPDGEIIGDYRKVHLRGEERLAFRAGFRFPVIEADFGLLGVLVGWDLAFPEAARSLALDGADIIAVCGAWEQSQATEWRTYTQARAAENAVFLAAANRVGQEPTLAFLGESVVLGPRGAVATILDATSEGYAIARIDLDQVRQAREESQVFQCREPQAYRSLVRRY